MEDSKISRFSKWIDASLDNFMIRLGYLKILSNEASSGTRNYDFLSKKMAETCTKTVKVNEEDIHRIAKYIEEKKLNAKGRRYSGLNTSSENQIIEIKVEMQDYYLSDFTLPSNLGAVPKHVQHELVQWGTLMGIIHPRRYSMSADGALLIAALSQSEKSALKEPAIEHNPFVIRQEKCILLHFILKTDGGLLRHFVPALREKYKDQIFSRLQSTEQLQYSLIQLDNELQHLKSSLSRKERKIIRNHMKQIEREEHAFKTLGKRRLFGVMRVSPRLENLVDLGLLQKDNSYMYQYCIPKKTASGFRSIPKFNKIDDFLYTSFFLFYSSIYGKESEEISDQRVILNLATRAYQTLGGRGYKRIEDIALIASMYSLEECNQYIEAATLEQFLENVIREGSEIVYLSSGKKVGDRKYAMFKGK